VRPKWLVRALIAAAALVLVAVAWFALQVEPLGGPGKMVVVTVHQGDSMSTIAGELHQAGVIASPLAFRIDTLFGAPVVRSGSYEIAQNSSFSHVKAVLAQGPNVYAVTVYPGFTVHEVAATLAQDRGDAFAAAFLAAARAAAAASPYHPDLSPPALSSSPDAVSPLEGLIGPGTYLVTPSESATSVLDAMTSAFAAEARAVGLSPSTRVNGLSAYQLLIGASIVEREGYYERNMPKVARVILNRLAKNRSLQMDSTVKYPLGLDAGSVTLAMLQTVTPYNTYLVTGLPPTPICAVSTAALRAMLNPPAGPWYYFVVINKAGDEKFAVTYDEQKANEARARKSGVG
jgi:UPF0755 protein